MEDVTSPGYPKLSHAQAPSLSDTIYLPDEDGGELNWSVPPRR